MKTFIILVVVVAIGAALYYWVPSLEKDIMAPTDTTATTADTSDAALDSDVSGVDAELSAFDADNAEVDSSLSATAQ